MPSAKQIGMAAVNAALVVVSVAVGYVGLEVAYRVYRYHALEPELVRALLQVGGDSTLSEFDPEVGFRYTANKSWRNTGPLTNAWRTNRYGLIANDIDRSDYPVEKPANEYRIALLGDSFTASNAVYLRWADLLQDYLNRSPEWRAFVGGKYTRVLNFGMDGTGIAQWAPVYDHRVRLFAPDVSIVSYITDNVRRRFIYRGQHRFDTEEQKREYVRSRAVEDMIAILPWYNPLYSELVNDTLGPRIGMKPRLSLAAALGNDEARYYRSHDAAIADSLASLRRIACLNPRTIVMQIALYEEVTAPVDNRARWPSTPGLVGLDTKFRKAAKTAGIPIVSLFETNPLPKDPFRLRAFYNIPVDTHLGDYGVAVYAAWVYGYLLDWSRAPRDLIPARGCA